MNTNWFIALNILLVGGIGSIILFFLIFLTRKRFVQGFLHSADENSSWLKRTLLKLIKDLP